MVFWENDHGWHGSHTGDCFPGKLNKFSTFAPDRHLDSFVYAAAVLQAGGHVYCDWLAKTLEWNTVELRDFRAQQQRHGRQFYLTACDSCCFAQRENFWKIADGKLSLLMFASRNIWVLQCQSNHSHTWRTVETRGRECPAAVVRRLVNGFVHDPTTTAASHVLDSSRQCSDWFLPHSLPQRVLGKHKKKRRFLSGSVFGS